MFRFINFLLVYIKEIAFNLHFQETFFVSKDQNRTIHQTLDEPLSISIFRRLSLFLCYFNVHSFALKPSFQSPFSGDFLCFLQKINVVYVHVNNFQSPFSGDFLCFQVFNLIIQVSISVLSISIFRRLSLFQGFIFV